MTTLAEITHAAETLPTEQRRRLVESLLASLESQKGPQDEAVLANLVPLAASAWSQDWDSAEEDEAWRDL
jgi:hypothetical protein